MLWRDVRALSGRTPQGVRGLKLRHPHGEYYPEKSHSARSAWIETRQQKDIALIAERRTPQGVRGLKREEVWNQFNGEPSHSARSAWIETILVDTAIAAGYVALRKECVD